jgi:hypothetical protein
MFYAEVLHLAGRTVIDETTLTELKKASMDLRAMTPHSVLADFVDAKIESIKSQNEFSNTRGACTG